MQEKQLSPEAHNLHNAASPNFIVFVYMIKPLGQIGTHYFNEWDEANQFARNLGNDHRYYIYELKDTNDVT